MVKIENHKPHETISCVKINKNLGSQILLHKAAHKKLLPYHTHNFYQILVLFQGTGKLRLNNQNFNLSPNHMVYINPDTKHKFYPNSNDVILYVIEFSHSLFSSKSNNKKILRPLNQLSTEKKILPLNNISTNAISILIKEMLHEINFKDSYYQNLIEIKLLHILILLLRFSSKEKKQIITKNIKHNGYITAIQDFIQENYYKKLGLDDIAGQIPLVKRQLTRIFKSVTNMTIIEYLNKVRIEKSMHLLNTQNKEIIYACFESGFNDLSYFYRVFKKYTGLTPKEYVKQQEKLLLNQEKEDI